MIKKHGLNFHVSFWLEKQTFKLPEMRFVFLDIIRVVFVCP